MVPIPITGAGVVSAVGVGKRQTLSALRGGQTGIAPVCYLATDDPDFLVGEVPLGNDAMKALLGLPADAVICRTSLMGIVALQEALAQGERLQASLTWESASHHLILTRMTGLNPALKALVVKAEKKKPQLH